MFPHISSTLRTLTAAMLLAVGTSAMGETIGTLTYDLNASTLKATVTGYASAPAGTLTIPATVTAADGKNYSVTTVGANAFRDTDITALVLPTSVTTINASAFEGCSKLAALNLDVATVYQHAFKSCTALKTLTVSVKTRLSSGVFENCCGLETTTINALPATNYTSIFAGCTGTLVINNWSDNYGVSSRNPINGAAFTTIDYKAASVVGCIGYNMPHLTTVNLYSPTSVSYSMALLCNCPNVKDINVVGTSSVLRSVDGVTYRVNGSALTMYYYPEGKAYCQLPAEVTGIGAYFAGPATGKVIPATFDLSLLTRSISIQQPTSGAGFRPAVVLNPMGHDLSYFNGEGTEIITVAPALEGDVNSDGKVNMYDIDKVRHAILQQ